MFVPETEISRLCELMPASGRMYVKIQSKPEQRQVLEMAFPLPWQRQKVISINFDLWQRLSQGQRDLILLRSVSWVLGVKWFKTDIYQGATAIGMIASVGEFFEGDLVGLVGAVGLTVLAATQVWRVNRSPQKDLEADEAAVKVAVRRGYTEAEAARHLYSGIERLAQLSGRSQLEFAELMRCQNLKAMVGLSRAGMSESG